MSLPAYIEYLDLGDIDLSNHHFLTEDIVSLNVVFMTFAILVTGIRMSIRLFIVRAAGLDDWLLLLATIFTILLCTFSLLGAHHGLGTHIWLLSATLPTFLHKATRITQCLYGCYISYATAITLVKLSLICSYLRIFPNPRFRQLILSTGVLVLIMWICSVFVTVFECVPVAAAWNWTERGRCINILAFFYLTSSVNIATDIVLWVAPLLVLRTLTMGRKERVMICGLFGFGFFACVASILRLSQLHGIHSRDITYASVPSLIWSVAEVCTALICACVPSMRPLASWLLPKSFQTSRSAPSGNTAPQPGVGVELSSQRTLGRGREVGDEEVGLRWKSRLDGEREERDAGDKLEEIVDIKDILRDDGSLVESSPQPLSVRVVGID